MLAISELLAGIGGVVVRGDATRTVVEVRDDSRLVGPGDLFVAVPGAQVDGRRFVDDALARGGVAIVTQSTGVDLIPPGSAAVLIQVPDARRALGIIAANRFGAATDMNLAGVTGTNGKTTTTYLVEAMLKAAGRRPGVVGTVSYRYADREQAAALTTPGALALHGLFADMKQAGTTDVVLEASSIALDQGRLAGCRFRAVGLSNVTQDHLDYHGTMERYFAAKAVLFRELVADGGTAALFIDREDGVRMRREMAGATRGQLLTLASATGVAADVAVARRQIGGDGTRALLDTPKGRIDIASTLVGDYNLANLVLATGLALGLGLAPEAIAAGAAALPGVPGRLERVPNQAGVLCVVDYAHTPDALERALGALRPITRARLIVVFGCGGDRDASKRSLMGAAAARLADLAIVTSDNPRSEDPEHIVAMVVTGARRTTARELDDAAVAAGEGGFFVAVDRRLAIRRAVAIARPGDTVLIAGKGHEDYQILGTTRIHFDDREEVSAAFAAAGQP